MQVHQFYMRQYYVIPHMENAQYADLIKRK